MSGSQAGTYRRNHVSHTLPLISDTHTHSPQGPEVPAAVGKGSQQHKPSMKSLWEQGQGRGVILYCPFPQQPKHGSCAGLPSHSTSSPLKSLSSGLSLETIQHHIWGSKDSTSAKMGSRDRSVQLDGGNHSCLHIIDALRVQDQQNPNSCPNRGSQSHFHSLYPAANSREGPGLPQLQVLLGATGQLQPANETQVSTVYSLSLSYTQVPLNLSLTPVCN